MKKYIGILFLFFSAVQFTNAQVAEIALKEYYVDAEFFMAQEYYADALHDYIEVYKRGYQENANINYKIGRCYLEIPGQKDKSIAYFEKAKSAASAKYKGATLAENTSPIDVYLYLGNAYRVNDSLNKAIDSYKKYKSLIPADQIEMHKYADKQIEACNVANEFFNNPKHVEFQNMGNEINSSTDDYKAVFAGDGNTIFFMHKLPFYDAVSVSKKVDGVWSRPENITPQIMSDGDQFVCCVSYDGTTLYLTKEDEYNSDLYYSKFVDNRWTPSQPVKGTDINTKYWESHASITKDGKTLYFTSNRKGGAGETDIYVAQLIANEVWGTPRNLGKSINTVLNEDTPFITEDGKTLYFSSQSNANMGGYDLFFSHKENDSTWSVPENLGYPFSSTDDDLFYFPFDNGKIGYVSRIREGGFGGMDIYKIAPIEAITEPITEAIPVQEETPIEEPPVLDTPVTETPGPAETVEQPVVTEEKPATEVIEQPQTTEEVKPVTVAVKTIEITPLLFEFDRASLNQEGKALLDKIITLMKENEDLELVITGFTDPLGPEEYNLRLSEKRALQALTYCVEKGISAKRLKAIGKGETGFIAPNTKADGADYPEGRKYNRRAEFEINGVDTKTLIINRIDPVPDNIKITGK